MKRLAFASATILTSVLSAPLASAQDATNPLLDNMQERSYVQAKLGFADFGLSDDAMTLTGTYGLELAHVHPQLSFEADAVITLADAESEVSDGFGSYKAEASVFALGAYLVGSYDQLPVDNLVPYARIGMAYTSVDVEVSSGNYSASGDGSEFGLGYGIGARYNFNDHLSVVAEYNDTEFDVYNVGAHYAF